DLPTPATYTIQVNADGYASETFSVRLDTAQQASGIEVRLRGGTGSISGSVAIVGEGPIGGVTITVSDGANSYSTESLSVGDVGSYVVDGLPLPGNYTITFSRVGLATQIRSIDLDAFGGGDRENVDANLSRATAAIHGTITDEGSTPLGGVQV